MSHLQSFILSFLITFPLPCIPYNGNLGVTQSRWKFFTFKTPPLEQRWICSQLKSKQACCSQQDNFVLGKNCFQDLSHKWPCRGEFMTRWLPYIRLISDEPSFTINQTGHSSLPDVPNIKLDTLFYENMYYNF